MTNTQSRFERIGKYITLLKTDKATKEILVRWRDLNVGIIKNGYDTGGRLASITEWNFDPEKFDFSVIPVPAAIQVMSDLKTIQWACCEHGDKVDREAYANIVRLIQAIEKSRDYKLTKHYENRVAL